MSTGHIPKPGQMSRYKKVARGEAPRRAHRPNVALDEPIDMTDLGAVDEASIVSIRETRTRRTHNEARAKTPGAKRIAVVAAALAAIGGAGAIVHALSGERDANAESSPNLPGVVATAQGGEADGNYGGDGRNKVKLKRGDICRSLSTGQVGEWASLVVGDSVHCDPISDSDTLDGARISGSHGKVTVRAFRYDPKRSDGCTQDGSSNRSVEVWTCDGSKRVEMGLGGVLTLELTGASRDNIQNDIWFVRSMSQTGPISDAINTAMS